MLQVDANALDSTVGKFSSFPQNYYVGYNNLTTIGEGGQVFSDTLVRRLLKLDKRSGNAPAPLASWVK